MKQTPTSSAGLRLVRGMTAATLLCSGFLGCVAPEEKTGGFTPPTVIAQLAVAPPAVNFTATFGSAPPDQTVDITGSQGEVSGLGIGAILYSPIVSGWLH